MANRPKIPVATRDQVLVESGHRCSIPTCRVAQPIDIAHIVPWSESKNHSPDNLIVLCANCHRLQERGKVSKNSLRKYKENLKITNSRYNDFERRVFEHIIHKKIILLGAGADIQLYNAIKDGILFIIDIDLPSGKTEISLNFKIGKFKLKEPPFPNQFLISISQYGEAFVDALLKGDPLDQVDQSLPKDSLKGDNWNDYFVYENRN